MILSGSFNEAASDLMTVAEWADYLIFGAHSPVYKKSFGLDFSSDPKEIVLSDSVYEFMDDGLREYVDSRETHRCPAVFRVTVKGNS